MSGVLTGLAVAAALSAAAASDDGAARTGLRLEEAWLAEEAAPARPDVRDFRERRRAAREEALGWLRAPADDSELAALHEAGRDAPPPLSFADFAEPSSGAKGLAWSRPSLLTLGRDPRQPGSEEWLRWQRAVDAARRWRVEHEAGLGAEGAPRD